MKSIITRLLALLLVGFLSPLMLIIVLSIFLLSPGSIFFAHQRIGRGGRPFKLLKFRTMKVDGSGGPNVTVAGDKRITFVGRFLRKFKLDELPQLLNVIAGDMTFVGPRPESPEYVALYTEEERKVLNYTPGLTDPASIKYRHEEQILATYPDPMKAYREIIMPDKIRLSIEYQQQRHFRSDFLIILQTIPAVSSHDW